MNRRKLIQSIAVGSVGLFHPNSADASVKQQVSQENNFNNKGSFSIDGNKVKFFNTKIEKPFNMLMLADTHLFRDDERGKPFQQYSSRMVSIACTSLQCILTESFVPHYRPLVLGIHVHLSSSNLRRLGFRYVPSFPDQHVCFAGLRLCCGLAVRLMCLAVLVRI